mmetsp:Transcript_436/g.575  ORF Transcript_436/g.575 Transcript_436/m.575 type:complete len:260 (-) Transcript_436:102-881(-)
MPEEEPAAETPEKSPKEASLASKADGNRAFGAGQLEVAKQCYTEALKHWAAAVQENRSKDVLPEGAYVSYGKEKYGKVMSVFPLMKEYFIKDLENDQPVWAGGQVGISLERFGHMELQPIETELFDLRFAVTQNLAAVHLKLEEYAEAVRWANAALNMNGKAPKALMRKGAALLRTARPAAAIEVLSVAAEALPSDKEVQRLLAEATKAAPESAQWVCAAGCIQNCAGLLCVPSLPTTSSKLTSTALAEAGSKKASPAA